MLGKINGICSVPYERPSIANIYANDRMERSNGVEIGWTIFIMLCKVIIFSKLQFYGRIHNNYGCVSTPITALENYSIMFAFLVTWR